MNAPLTDLLLDDRDHHIAHLLNHVKELLIIQINVLAHFQINNPHVNRLFKIICFNQSFLEFLLLMIRPIFFNPNLELMPMLSLYGLLTSYITF